MNAETKVRMPSIYERLAAEFPRNAIHWRAQSVTKAGDKALALAYLDARDVQDRLDLVCGPAGWRNTVVETAKGRVLSTIEINIEGQWVGKTDGAGDTAVEGEKGALSDAFKRCAVLWGIGRYLYRLPAVWAPCESADWNGKKQWKKWRGDPWASVPSNWQPTTYTDPVADEIVDPETGEILDGNPTHEEVDEALREPAARAKLDGPHTSKTALREAVHAVIAKVRTVESLEDLEALKTDSKRTINQALRDWPLLINGDPRIAEDLGLKGEIEKRREELTPSTTFQFLISCVNECTTSNELKAFLAQHGEAVEMLDGAESRDFENVYDVKAAALKLVDQVSA